MNRSSLLLGLITTLALAGCASTPTVQTDHDPGVDFSKYHTYSWLTTPDGASPLGAQRITEYVDAAMQAKGLQKAEHGDVTIAAHVATQQRQSIDTFYNGPMYAGWGGYGWGGRGYGMSMSSSSTSVHYYNVGTLIVDMFDTSTKKGIWRGSASGTIPSDPQKTATMAQAGVQKMFAEFPPGSTAQ